MAFYDIKDISKLRTIFQSSKNHHFILEVFVTKLNKNSGYAVQTLKATLLQDSVYRRITGMI